MKEPLKIAIEVGSPQNACALVKLGAGIALVDEFSLRGWSSDDFAMIPLDGAPEIVAHLVYPRTEPLSQVAVSFLELLQSTLDQAGFALPG
jgi:DNA-binding transcriptional LysR family regulator